MKKVIYSTIAIIMIASAAAFAGNNITGKAKTECTCTHCNCPNTTGCTCTK
jgi:hypothetical protein